MTPPKINWAGRVAWLLLSILVIVLIAAGCYYLATVLWETLNASI